jgi:hypothetical protein
VTQLDHSVDMFLRTCAKSGHPSSSRHNMGVGFSTAPSQLPD